MGSTGRNWGVTSHSSAEDALASFIEEQIAKVPVSGYRIEREVQDRVLYSYDVAGNTRVAFIVGHDVADGALESGWSVETFAQCDPAELPPAVTDALGIDIWVNEKGERVPVTVLRSNRGPEHCNWDGATFLDYDGDTFVRDPRGVLPAQWFDGTFDSDATLPPDAEETGYRLGRQALWLATDRSAAYIVTRQEIERWPAAKRIIGCA